MRIYFCALLCLLSLIKILPACAEPQVIADFGGRNSGVTFPREMLLKALKESPLLEQPSENTLNSYPVLSSIGVGLVEPHKINPDVQSQRVQPFFIVGDDASSREWLAANAAELTRYGARGIVANVLSEARLRALQEMVAPLSLVAVPVDEIAKIYGIDAYPVLVLNGEILQ
jgi:integrating conjugative element protein (TIGR03765 family)